MDTAPSLTAAQRAALAWCLQRRIAQWSQDCDPGWQRAAAGRPGEPPLAAGDAGRRQASALFERRIGPLPPLPALAEGAGHMALLDRQALQAQLCALALLGRPGVLRCCVQRDARQALQQALGPAYAPLRARAAGAPAVPGEVAAWAPLSWAWVAWRELQAAGAWPHRSLRRLARAMLPAGRAEAPRLASAPSPSLPLAQRLRELDGLFGRQTP